jgi:uncharacterized protein
MAQPVTNQPGKHSERRVVRRAQLQLTIFVRASDTHAGRPLHHEIIDRARRAGLHGATAVRGLQGFGASANLRRTGLAGLTGHEPVLVEVTDDADRVLAFLPSVEHLAGGGLIVLKAVTSVRAVADLPDIATSAVT